MIQNTKLIRLLKILTVILSIPLLITYGADIIEPRIKFHTPEVNRIWFLTVNYLFIFSFCLTIAIINSYKKIYKWILLFIYIPISLIVILMLLITHFKIEYQPRYDRYIVYQQIDNKNHHIVVQDYSSWKTNKQMIDTTFIKDYGLVRYSMKIDTLNIQGTWIKYNENKDIVDTIIIK